MVQLPADPIVGGQWAVNPNRVPSLQRSVLGGPSAPVAKALPSRQCSPFKGRSSMESEAALLGGKNRLAKTFLTWALFPIKVSDVTF